MTRFVFSAVVALALGLGATAVTAQQVSVDVAVTVTGRTPFGTLGVPTLGSGPVLITCVIPNSFYTKSFWHPFPVAGGTPCFIDQIIPGMFRPVRLHGYTV